MFHRNVGWVSTDFTAIYSRSYNASFFLYAINMTCCVISLCRYACVLCVSAPSPHILLVVPLRYLLRSLILMEMSSKPFVIIAIRLLTTVRQAKHVIWLVIQLIHAHWMGLIHSLFNLVLLHSLLSLFTFSTPFVQLSQCFMLYFLCYQSSPLENYIPGNGL